MHQWLWNPSKTAVNAVALQRSSQMWRKWQVNITQVFLNKLPTDISFFFFFFFFFHYIEHVLLLHTYYFLWNLFILCILRLCLFSVLFNLFSTNKFMYTKSQKAILYTVMWKKRHPIEFHGFLYQDIIII